jgi:hypothetical protein
MMVKAAAGGYFVSRNGARLPPGNVKSEGAADASKCPRFLPPGTFILVPA